jgi:predicted nucleotidyltransferase
MISLEMFQAVADELRRIERQYGVQVLYACESGSRAWGFASRDSDYDVRFLYVQSRDWYRSIEDQRDVIEEPIHAGLDLSGWELRKALRLLRKSNPPLLEWLKSPVVYQQDERFIPEFRALAVEYYSPARCFQHYLHMASGNVREYLKGDMVWLKKYLYVLRPLLACRWIERQRGEVPMRFDDLVRGVVEEPDVRQGIAQLLVQKRAGEELDRAPKIESLSRFIAAELPRLESLRLPDEDGADVQALNRFFGRYCLESVIGSLC